jgi:hypothetical protein
MTKSTGVGRGGQRDGAGRPPKEPEPALPPSVQKVVDTDNFRRLLERAEATGAATMPKSVKDMTSKDVLRYCYTYHMTRAAAYQAELKGLQEQAARTGQHPAVQAVNALLGRVDAYLLAARDAAALAAPYEHHRLSSMKLTPPDPHDIDLSTWPREKLEQLARLMEEAGVAQPGGYSAGATTPRH